MVQVVFGPVPSRRLGRSIGVNHIPPKICTYACRYCQLGKAIKMQVEREDFYKVSEILMQVEALLKRDDQIDFITLVPDGEPGLDKNLGEIIDGLKKFGIPVAAITNSSMLWDESIRTDFLKTDRISVKVDAAFESTWKKIDRPHKKLNFENIIKGLYDFSKSYSGYLMTETMLINNLNDNIDELKGIAEILETINPDISYIAIPTRPPADSKIKAADEESLQLAWSIFSEKVKKAELLVGYEGNEFSVTGDSVHDILSITAVHPMRKDAILELLNKNGDSYDLVKKLILDKKLLETEYEGKRFFLRKMKKNL